MTIKKIDSLFKASASCHRVSGIPKFIKDEWNTIFDSDGPGMITHIWFTFPVTDKMLGRRSLLRIFWDNEADPSVEAPLTDFFGVPFGFTGTEFRIMSQYLTVAPQNGFNCYFSMPFARHARIEILPEQIESGGGFYYQVDYYRFFEQLPNEFDNLRFHAQFRFENPCENYGRNYLFLDASGTGALIGATFGIEINQPEADPWYHGGGDSIFIDGEREPSVLHGIGAEDFFGHSWGVNEYQSQYTGTVMQEYDSNSRICRLALYRFFSNDPILFRSSIRAIIGALKNNYTSVAYWYQDEPHIPFFRVPDADHRMSNSIAAFGSFDIEPEGVDEWKILAPFKIDDNNPFDGEQPFELAETGDETYIYESEGTASLPDGNIIKVKWKQQKAYHNFVDFNVEARPAVHCISLQTGVAGYALRYVECSEDRDAVIVIGYDDEAVVRINGNQIFRARHDNGFSEETFRTYLKKGNNRILVKLSNYDNTSWRLWAFSFRIED